MTENKVQLIVQRDAAIRERTIAQNMVTTLLKRDRQLVAQRDEARRWARRLYRERDEARRELEELKHSISTPPSSRDIGKPFIAYDDDGFPE